MYTACTSQKDQPITDFITSMCMLRFGWKTYSPLFSKDPYTSDVEELNLGNLLKIDDPS